MKIANAVKKLEKASGKKVEKDERSNEYYVIIKKKVVSFMKNGMSDDAVCFYVRNENLHDDIQTDYFAGSFFRNLTQAINYAIKY